MEVQNVMVRLDPELLRTLLAVDEADTASRAAELLHVSESAVSARLRKLGDVTGAPIVRPSGRSIALTPHGKRVLDAGRGLVHAHDDVVRRLGAVDAPITLRVLTNEVFFLDTIAELTDQMRGLHPHVTIEWNVDPAVLRYPYIDEDFDLVACQVLETAAQPADRVAWTDDLHWITGTNHPHDVDDGRSLPLVTFRPTCFYHDLGQRALDDAGIDHHLAVLCPTFAALNTAVAAGAGVAVLNTRNRRPGSAPWIHAARLPTLPRIAQICRVRPHAPPATHDLAELLTTIAAAPRPEDDAATA
ncbi:MAG: LysR family transcriptional regulator [Actinomycetota bacterium]